MKLSQYLRLAVSVNEIKRKYPEAVEDIDLALKQGLLQKHLNWFAIHRLDAPLPKLVDLSKQFEKLSKRMDPKDKNIDVWNKKSIPELENFLNSFGESGTKMKAQVKSGAKLLIKDDPNYWVYRIDTKEAAITYGKGTKWCIAAKNNNMFDTYYNDSNARFLFLIKKNPIQDRTNKESRKDKIAISLVPRNIEVWDTSDNAHRKGDKQRKGRKLDWLKFVVGSDLYNRLVPIMKSTTVKNKEIILNRYKKQGGELTENGWVFKGDLSLQGLNLTSIPDKIYEIRGDLNISDNKIINLNNLPEKVWGNFYCDRNKLLSLKGCPKTIGGSFSCSGNSLKSLKGGPIEVGKNYSCIYNELTSLDGCPKTIGRSFSCDNNNLKSLKGGPIEVGKDYSCDNNELTSLSGAPNIINGYFFCTYNNLVSLEGGPEVVTEWYYCSGNKLNSLIGGPKETGSFYCEYNKEMKYFGGAPGKSGTIVKVKGNFDCENCGLLSLEGGPQVVTDTYKCSNNPGKFTVEYVKGICSVGYVRTDRR